MFLGVALIVYLLTCSHIRSNLQYMFMLSVRTDWERHFHAMNVDDYIIDACEVHCLYSCVTAALLHIISFR